MHPWVPPTAEELPCTLDGTHDRTLGDIDDRNRIVKAEELAEFQAYDFDRQIPALYHDHDTVWVGASIHLRSSYLHGPSLILSSKQTTPGSYCMVRELFASTTVTIPYPSNSSPIAMEMEIFTSGKLYYRSLAA
jgi:hypothetical protein